MKKFNYYFGALVLSVIAILAIPAVLILAAVICPMICVSAFLKGEK